MRGRGLQLLTLSPEGEPNLIMNSTGKNPCRPLAGIRDRGRRPCEGFSDTSATQPVVSARTAFRDFRDADVRSARLRASIHTDYATFERRPALLPAGCAIIFRSTGRRAELLLLSRVAGRSVHSTRSLASSAELSSTHMPVASNTSLPLDLRVAVAGS